MKVSPRLADLLNLERAWKRVWRDRTSDFVQPGREYVVVNRKPSALLQYLEEEIRSGDCRVSPLRRVDVVKTNHTLRPGAIPEIKDRVLYQALVDYVAELRRISEESDPGTSRKSSFHAVYRHRCVL